MSQQLPHAFRGGAIDPSLSYMGEDDGGFHQQLDSVFGPFSTEPTFTTSPATSDVLDDLSSTYDTALFSSATTSGVSTPDFSAFNFGHRVQRSLPSNYPPPPNPGQPNPYPIQLQRQRHGGDQHILQLPHRPAPVRAATNTEGIRPQAQQHSTRVNQPFHRRSLSQGDAELLAARATNPQLFCLQHGRGRSVTPGPNDGRSLGRKARGCAPTSTPCGNMPLVQTHVVRGHEPMPMFSRHDGTPIGISVGMTESSRGDLRGVRNGQSRTGAPGHVDNSLPLMARGRSHGNTENGRPRYELRHMSEEEKRRESRRVIEIGALMVLKKGGSTGTAGLGNQRKNEGEGEDGIVGEDKMLKMVDRMETHIRRTGDPSGKGLTAVEMFREVLAENTQVGDCDTNGSASPYMTPGAIFSEADSLFDAHPSPNDDIYAMHMNEHDSTELPKHGNLSLDGRN
ncbi:hypothetical protein P154DRAFT_534408 [Amniculicola lignicola CBS 123094]|uniref:Uncharacterized protein n=1 Tax=Amniculicola lignicola CBS 123094 TaxID=1392246 RepID=A0A6A5WHQ7_9PLEO|nr:hypothetical protein P154DRAFT_534408 [Amniculicola lignicola CBS 123094]